MAVLGRKKEAKEAEVVKEVKETKVKKVTAKTVKKDASKTVNAVVKTVADLRELTVAQLHEALKTAREDLLMVQKMLHANELPNTHVVRNAKKQIARIHAMLTEKNNNADKEAK
jgi:ribosomal protein L29